jgi:mono/diheme cytochrome c family protein
MTWRIRIIAASAVFLVIAVGMMTWLPGKDEPQGSTDANDIELVALGPQINAERCASCHGTRL